MAFPPHELMHDPRLRRHPGAKLLAVALWWPVSPDDREPRNWQAVETLARRAGLTRSAAFRAKAVLLEACWVSSVREAHPTSGSLGKTLRLARSPGHGTSPSRSWDIPVMGLTSPGHGTRESRSWDSKVPSPGRIGEEGIGGEYRGVASSPKMETTTTPQASGLQAREPIDNDDRGRRENRTDGDPEARGDGDSEGRGNRGSRRPHGPNVGPENDGDPGGDEAPTASSDARGHGRVASGRPREPRSDHAAPRQPEAGSTGTGKSAYTQPRSDDDEDLGTSGDLFAGHERHGAGAGPRREGDRDHGDAGESPPSPGCDPETDPSPRAVGRRPRREPSPDAIEAAQYLYDAIKSHSPEYKAKVKPAAVARTLASWAKAIDVGLNNHGFELADYKRAIDHAHRRPETFWRPNIMSGTKLRDQCEQLLAQAKHSHAGPGSATPAGYTSDGVRLDTIDYSNVYGKET